MTDKELAAVSGQPSTNEPERSEHPDPAAAVPEGEPR